MKLKELEGQYAALTADTVKSFIKGIHATFISEEVSTLSLLSFLEGVLTRFQPEGRRICSLRGELPSQDRDNLTLYARITAAMMLILERTKSYADLKGKTQLFLAYSAAVVKTKYDFAALFLESLNYRIVQTGLSWRAIQEDSLDVLCFALERGIQFDSESHNSFSFSGKGRLDCREGRLKICSSNAIETGNKAFSILDDRINVITRNTREERLKSSNQDDVKALSEFADIFIETQNRSPKESQQKKEIKPGDKVNIMLTGLSETEDMLLCSSVDSSDDRLRGKIINEELVRGTWTKDLIPYLFDGDCIRDAVLVGKEEGAYLFSIRDAYMAFAKRQAETDLRNNTVMEAVVLEVKKDMYDGRVTWMTPSGYGGISLPIAGRKLVPGEKVVMTVANTQKSGSSLFINLCPPKYGYDAIDQVFDPDGDVLKQFVTSVKMIRSEFVDKAGDEKNRGRVETIWLLASILANRAERKVSLNTYRQRLGALFLLNLISDKVSFESLLPETFYLRCCISFAQGNDVPPVLPYKLPEMQETILRMLAMWGRQEQGLLDVVAATPAQSGARKIGSLILGLSISSRFRDEFGADEDVVRKRICSLLGVGELFVKKEAVRFGKYGHAETQEVEFKSSYVFRNDDKGPDIDYQGRGQVFEAVCGFLNADGGTVYVGVNNNGDPLVSEDSGLNADIGWLRENYKLLNGMRARQLGHAVCEVKDYDSYVQFLNSEKELYFKESLLGNIVIEVTEDVDAIRITVAPAEYEIAYLYSDKTRNDGRAFVRDGGRTVEMTRVQKERRLAALKRISKEMGFVVAIQEAIDRQRKLIFKGYASGNSGEVQDRLVVPVNLFYNDENVYCYDLASRKYKQFRLHRISSIETLPETYALQKSSPKKADVFRWLDDGGRRYHIKLRMEVGARNYLLEEYSCAEKLPSAELYEEKKNIWILDTYVNGLGAVRRFYLGLADKIEILETENSSELKKEIQDYAEMFIVKQK